MMCPRIATPPLGEHIVTKGQALLRKMACPFAPQYCGQEAADLAESHEFLYDTWKKMVQVGLRRVNHGKKYGGINHVAIGEMVVIEGLSKACLTHGAIYVLLSNGFPMHID